MTTRLARGLSLAVAAAALTLPAQGAVNSDKAYNLATRLAAAMERCWFASGDTTFAGYVYSPEPNATNGPRILIVPKQSPGERPVLVIQISTSGHDVNVYGPLAGSAAGRIGADLKRWINGGEDCG